jgi:hypothetical protein
MLNLCVRSQIPEKINVNQRLKKRKPRSSSWMKKSNSSKTSKGSSSMIGLKN